MKKEYATGVRGRTAVITGASSGIGEAFAHRLAAEGYDLILAARRKELLSKLADDLCGTHGIRAEAVTADLSTDAGVSTLEKIIKRNDSLHMLVHSAGFGTRGFFSEVDPDKIRSMIHVHVTATARLTRAALPGMIAKRDGVIINVSSIGAFLTTSHYTAYSATKAFINMLTLGLRDELAGSGVRVQALCPGLTSTGFMYTEEFKDFNYGDIPRFAWMTPGRVVEESLTGVKKNKAIVIPGRGNRIFVGALRSPLFGPALGGLLSLMGRGRNAY